MPTTPWWMVVLEVAYVMGGGALGYWLMLALVPGVNLLATATGIVTMGLLAYLCLSLRRFRREYRGASPQEVERAAKRGARYLVGTVALLLPVAVGTGIGIAFVTRGRPVVGSLLLGASGGLVVLAVWLAWRGLPSGVPRPETVGPSGAPPAPVAPAALVSLCVVALAASGCCLASLFLLRDGYYWTSVLSSGLAAGLAWLSLRILRHHLFRR